ncbi:MAG: Fic family protein [Nanoarchaeota archaeon]
MRLFKRKKGKNEYYYLQHSFREGKKVITKEKYLGLNIPKDFENIKNDFMKKFKGGLHQKLVKIKNDFQKEWGKIPKSIIRKQLEEISIAFTYNTNAIEGSTITLAEARAIIRDKIAPNKPLRDIKETETHNKVFLEMLEKKEKISEGLLLRWHKEIFGETKQDIAGKYRDHLVRVGSYVAPDWQDVNKLMKELIIFIEKNKKMNPVELAGRAHFKFESIHPFGDGNGRIGRLLMNNILWYSGYPMIIIEYARRKSYYKAFPRGEEGFLNYFIRRYLAVHKNRIK